MGTTHSGYYRRYCNAEKSGSEAPTNILMWKQLDLRYWQPYHVCSGYMAGVSKKTGDCRLDPPNQ